MIANGCGTEQDRLALLGSFVKIIDPVGRPNGWSTSRLGVHADGSLEPILVALARLKFGTYSHDDFIAYWGDKDWSNETLENVKLARRTRRGRRVNPYGAPAGTKEYWTAYRAANKDKLRAYAAKSRARVKDLQERVAREETERLLRAEQEITDLLAGAQ